MILEDCLKEILSYSERLTVVAETPTILDISLIVRESLANWTIELLRATVTFLPVNNWGLCAKVVVLQLLHKNLCRLRLSRMALPFRLNRKCLVNLKPYLIILNPQFGQLKGE
jgi:hypothetical protein